MSERWRPVACIPRAALFQKFGVSLLSAVGISLQGAVTRIPSDKLDLSDPDRPTYLGKVENL